MAFNMILYDKDKETGAAVITMNKPEVLNAWGGRMKEEMMEAINDAGEDPSVTGLIFTGAGRGFGAGGYRAIGGKVTPGYEPALSDAGTPQSHYDWLPGDEERAMMGLSHDTPHLIERLFYFDKPTIAAINGVVAGGHTALISVCDIRIGSENARYRCAFTRDGFVPDVGSSYWLPKLVGVGKALEIAYTNDFIDAQELLRIGLLNQVVSPDELIPYCKNMVKRMKQIAPSVLFASKKAIRACGKATQRDLEEGYMLERWASGLIDTEEREESRKSNIERRPPAYKGRGIKMNIRW
ncbi:MAG: enoyl-CoA hydratase/isomerase family protein [Dehalococcoidales bacterium]|nr:enoyl-CoA hydratase/isomerase family protein [Dehalococcoidales bacterium]